MYNKKWINKKLIVLYFIDFVQAIIIKPQRIYINKQKMN